MIIPIALATGVAVDVGRAVATRTALQDAVGHATALALAHLPTTTPVSTLQADAQIWMDANLSGRDMGPLSITVTPTQGQLSVSAGTTVTTTVSAVAGVSLIPVNATTTVKWGLSHVELALVLDNTSARWSSSNKLPTLISAATSLVDTLSTTAGTDPDAL